MPKTSKREATRRRAKIARMHATELPPLKVKEPGTSQRLSGGKQPARGLARYPWAITLTLLLIAVSIYGLYYYQVGPFAKAKVQTPAAVVSPCIQMEKQLTDTASAPDKAAFAKIVHKYASAPKMTINTKAVYCAGINTNRGLIVLELDPQIAPVTVNNFVFLAQHQFYDGLVFHRVVPGFVIQTGDPLGTGKGGPGYKFNDEKVQGKYTAGVVAMANSGANTNGSQFFITLANDSTTLQPLYNLFGHVVAGMNVVLKIQGPDPDAGKLNITPDVMNHVIVLEAK